MREPGSETTQLDNGQSSETVWCYNSNYQVTEQDDYGLSRDGAAGALPACNQAASAPDGPLLRQTVTTYADATQPALASAHIIDRPAGTVLCDGTHTPVAATDYNYDQTGVAGAGVTVGRDSSYNGNSSIGRGNLTTLTHWTTVSGSGCSSTGTGMSVSKSGALNTTYTWDDTGQLLSMKDPAGNLTSYTWGDAASSPVGNTDAFLLQVTNALGQTDQYSWDYLTGHVLSHTGKNHHPTSFVYNDLLNRLTEIDYPDGGETTVSYNDTEYHLWTEVRRKIDTGGDWTDAFTYFDGLGRPVTACSANGEATPWDRVDTVYDGLGQTTFRTYPYQDADCTATSSQPGDSFTFDALGRPLTVTHSDGSQISTSYAGAATEIEDEGNGSFHVTRVLQHDGLGRLVSVCESDAGDANAGQVANSSPGACSGQIPGFAQDTALPTGFETGYSYDALGNLTHVAQGSETRRFAYDSLSRLLTANNPESGTTSYGYDADSNVVSKTDARGETVTMSYDALNRLLSKYYSDDPQQERRVALDYDQTSVPGFTFANGIGRLTQEWVGLGPEEQRNYSYDAMGRAINAGFCAPSVCGSSGFPLQFSYNLLGEVTQVTYPDGRVVQTQYNRAGRATAVTGISFGGQATHVSYLTGATYTASGQPHVFTLGNGTTDSFGYDPRQRLNHRETASAEAGTLFNRERSINRILA